MSRAWTKKSSASPSRRPHEHSRSFFRQVFCNSANTVSHSKTALLNFKEKAARILGEVPVWVELGWSYSFENIWHLTPLRRRQYDCPWNRLVCLISVCKRAYLPNKRENVDSVLAFKFVPTEGRWRTFCLLNHHPIRFTLWKSPERLTNFHS